MYFALMTSERACGITSERYIVSLGV
jgi:hypothetical protein